nr:DegT/DnrJ/EryC1/StrS family aminotransferase [Phycisphaerae bacterium]
MKRQINLSAQDITEAEINAVVAVLRSERLSLGPRIPEFEAEFTKRLGEKHAIACSSGTAGLHM